MLCACASVFVFVCGCVITVSGHVYMFRLLVVVLYGCFMYTSCVVCALLPYDVFML